MMVLSSFSDKAAGPFKVLANVTVIPLQQGINYIGGWLGDMKDNFSTMEQLRAENESLQEQVDALTTENNYLQEESYLLLNEFRNTPRYLSVWETEKELFRRLNIDCVAAMRSGSEVVGLVMLSAKTRDHSFTAVEVGFLETVSSIASIALKNASLYEKIFREARIDPLTGMYNYRYFVEQLEEQFRACGKECLTLMYIDVDDFKLYNQLYGVGEGDAAAREKLIASNLRLVLSVIQRFAGRGENVDDLFQVGCIGLIKAVDNFDSGQGVRFSTYGVPMIAGEIRRYLRDNSALRISRSMRDTAYKALQAREKLTAERGRTPTPEEIAAAIGAKREEVVFALEAITDPVSLSEPVYSDSGESVAVLDQISDTQETPESWVERMALSDAVAALGEREKRILSMRYYDGKTQMEVAREINISQAQVSRLEKSAVEQIRKSILPQ